MQLNRFLGFQGHTSINEMLVSTLGATTSITLIASLSVYLTGMHGAMAILLSMGAATVLLFALPHGALSQPWALFAGNLISAAVGVSCAMAFDNAAIAAGLAVGLSVLTMHLCRCTHPPGGATALAAVIGGDSIRALGYSYILIPTLLNCLIIFLVAMAFNNIFAWRRYPASLMRFKKSNPSNSGQRLQLTHIQQAMESMDTLVDASAEQIKGVIDLARVLQQQEILQQFELELGAFYTNGLAGQAWSVRQVVDEAPHNNPDHHMVIYRTVDGNERHRAGSCTLGEFAQWAQEKMIPSNES